MVLMVIAVVVASVSSARVAMRRSDLQSNLRWQGLLMLLLWSVYNAYYFTPSRFTWHTSLPLHVCDILGPVSAIAIATSNRMARTALYFCGVVLAGQAVVTPTGDQDPAQLRFWLYWMLHAGIIALSMLDLLVLQYRPKVRDYLQALGFDLAYATAIVPINIWFGWNYGYLGNDVPGVTTAISFLGPWPLRIATILLAAAVLQGLMLLPWLIQNRFRNKDLHRA